MGSKEGSAGGARTTREIRFSDTDAGASLPVVPATVAPPTGERATMLQWAAQAGHIAPPVPKGGFRHRGERHRGFDVRILIVHLRAHATPERPYVEGQLMTRAEYDALVAEAQGVACGNASPARAAVESMVAWKGDFITREKFESMSQKAEGG
jgi:hypothetical protein